MIEEKVLLWFCHQGFEGERDRKSNITGLFPTSGYADLFASLVEMPDLSYYESLDQARKQEWSSSLATPDDVALPLGQKREDLIRSLDSFRWKNQTLRSLSQAVGSDEVIESLYTSIIQKDGYLGGTIANGTPDLFIWHPDSTLHLWFFAEVKGPRDSLRESQSIWIKQNWERIQGRVILVHIL